MAKLFKFNIAGLGDTVQFGKRQGQIRYTTTAGFEVRNADLSSLATLKVGAPVDASDVATKTYVDSVSQGLQIKDSVDVATNMLSTDDMQHITYSSTTDTWEWTSQGVTPTLDNSTLADGFRVLIKDSTDTRYNGIFVYDSANTSFTRAPDADGSATGKVSPGTFVFVELGQNWKSSGWVISGTGNEINVPADQQNWTLFSKTEGIRVGSGLVESNDVMSVQGDNSTIFTINDQVAVKSGPTTGDVLLARSANQSAEWGKVNLDSSTVTGNLSRANGGLGSDISSVTQGSILVSGPATGGAGNDGTTTSLQLGNANEVVRTNSLGTGVEYGILNVNDSTTGTIGIARGGTGLTSYNNGDIMVGTAGGALQSLAVGSTNQVLAISGGGVPNYVDATSLPGNTHYIKEAMGIADVTLAASWPASVNISSITIVIETAYQNSTKMYVRDTEQGFNDSIIVDHGQVDQSTIGHNVFHLDHTLTSTQGLLLDINVPGASGGGYIIVTYHIL